MLKVAVAGFRHDHILVCLFTLCIGMLWYGPFVQAFCARYYDMLRKEYELKQSAMQAE